MKLKMNITWVAIFFSFFLCHGFYRCVLFAVFIFLFYFFLSVIFTHHDHSFFSFFLQIIIIANYFDSNMYLAREFYRIWFMWIHNRMNEWMNKWMFPMKSKIFKESFYCIFFCFALLWIFIQFLTFFIVDLIRFCNLFFSLYI